MSYLDIPPPPSSGGSYLDIPPPPKSEQKPSPSYYEAGAEHLPEVLPPEQRGTEPSGTWEGRARTLQNSLTYGLPFMRQENTPAEIQNQTQYEEQRPTETTIINALGAFGHPANLALVGAGKLIAPIAESGTIGRNLLAPAARVGTQAAVTGGLEYGEHGNAESALGAAALGGTMGAALEAPGLIKEAGAQAYATPANQRVLNRAEPIAEAKNQLRADLGPEDVPKIEPQYPTRAEISAKYGKSATEEFANLQKLQSEVADTWGKKTDEVVKRVKDVVVDTTPMVERIDDLLSQDVGIVANNPGLKDELTAIRGRLTGAKKLTPSAQKALYELQSSGVKGLPAELTGGGSNQVRVGELRDILRSDLGYPKGSSPKDAFKRKLYHDLTDDFGAISEGNKSLEELSALNKSFSNTMKGWDELKDRLTPPSGKTQTPGEMYDVVANDETYGHTKANVAVPTMENVGDLGRKVGDLTFAPRLHEAIAGIEGNAAERKQLLMDWKKAKELLTMRPVLEQVGTAAESPLGRYGLWRRVFGEPGQQSAVVASSKFRDWIRKAQMDRLTSGPAFKDLAGDLFGSGLTAKGFIFEMSQHPEKAQELGRRIKELDDLYNQTLRQQQFTKGR